MANILPWIVVLAFSSIAYSEDIDYSCEYRSSDGSGTFTYVDKILNDGEFTVAFKVLANSDVRLILSPVKEDVSAAYIITIGERNELTFITRFGSAELLQSYTVKDAYPFRESELRCYDNCMNSYWICFQNGMIKLGRGGDSAPFFEFDVPAEETFNPRYMGFGTGSSNIGMFGGFRFADECTSQGSGTDTGTTTKRPRDCQPVDCGAQTCLFGLKKVNGCDTCECQDNPCEVLINCMPCKHGYERDEFQCDTCNCLPGPCDEEPCQNGGYCYGVGVTDYGCKCTEGYTGRNCEEDVQNPTITCPADMTTTTDTGAPSASITYEPATATDNSGEAPAIVCAPDAATLPVGANTIQCIATDGSGNTASCTYKITVNDEEPPAPDCPIPMEEPTDAGKPYATVNYEIPSVTDNSDPSPDFVCDKLPGSEFPVGQATVTCTASDKYGNSDTCTFTVDVKDKEAPEFDCPLPMDNVPVDGGEPFATVNYPLPTVTDNVDSDITVTCVEPPGSQFPIGRSEITCTATDQAENFKTCPFSIIVADNEAPKMTCPDPMAQTTDAGRGYATVTYDTPVANDNSDPNPNVVCELPSGSKFWIAPNTVTCTATDNVGNSDTCDFPVTIRDEEPPTIPCPEPMDDVSTDEGRDVATVNYDVPVGQDNEDPKPLVSCDRLPGSEFPIGDSTVTCTVTDRSGNSAECSFTITVKDDEKPKITCPLPMPDVSTDDGQPTATVDYPAATSSDNADPDPTIDCIPPVNSQFPIGTTTVRCTATDDAGNKKMCPFDVTVSDKEKPKLPCPDPMARSTDTGKSFASIDYQVPTATDNVDASPAVTCFEPSGSEFSLGQTVVECTAIDSAQNEESCTFTIDVTDDEKPEMECPQAMTEPVDAGQNYATVEYSTPFAFDNADPAPVVTCTPVSGSQFQLGPQEVTCKALDDAGNRKRCTFTITVEDKEGPTIECPLPMPESADPGSSTTAVVYNDPKVSDNTDANPTVSCTPASGSDFTIGSTEVTCTAQDNAGNTNECFFHVVVKDTEAPDFMCPVPMLESMDPGQSFATVTYAIPSASDNWDAEVQVVCAPAPGTAFNAGVTTTVCSAVDAARNKRNCTFPIEVQDNEEPELTCPIPMEEFVDAGKAFATVDFDVPTANDNADPIPRVECSKQPNSEFDIGTNTVTCTATDNSDNSKECTFTVEVTDNEKPKFTCPEAMNDVSTDSGESFATVDYVLPPATDNADPAPTRNCDKPSGSQFPLGPSTVSCTAADKYGNSKTCTFTINVVDDEEPEMKCPDPMTETTDLGQSYATVNYPAPTVTDNADSSPSVSCEKASGSKFFIEPNVVVCTARDNVGNTASCTFPVTVKDEEKPKVTCPGAMKKSFDAGKPYATITYEKPSASDNVDPAPVVTCIPASMSQVSQLGPNKFKCTATDNFLNSKECEFIVEVGDDEKPEITCPNAMDENVDPGMPFATVSYDIPVAKDNYDPNPTVVCSPAPSSQFTIGTKTVQCTAMDSNNNKNSCRFNVTVYDNEPPILTCASTSITQNTDVGKDYATVDYSLPTASDNADLNPSINCDRAPGFQFPIGSATVTCTATDNADNSATCTLNIRVKDKEPPTLPCPSPMSEFTDRDEKYATVAYDEPEATDNDNQNPTVDCRPKPNSQIDIGTQVVTCTATDTAGNMNTCDFDIKVIDNQEPEFTCPIDMSQPADVGQMYTYVSYVTPRAQDNSGVEPPVVCDPSPGSQFFIDSNTVTCTAVDTAGNIKTCTFTVTVTDEEAPKLTCPEPMKRSVDAGKDYATVRYNLPAVTDNRDQNLVATCDIESASQLSVQLHTIACTATDTAGNTGRCSFTARVTDDEAPKFDCPLSMTEDTDPRQPTSQVSYTVPTANDNVDGSVEVTCTPAPGTPFGVGTNTVTCTATDSAGNVKTCPFTIQVNDNEEPEYECPIDMLDVSVDAGQAYGTVTYTLPEVTDNVDSNLLIRCIEPPGFQFPIGKSEVHCRATDSASNTKECSFSIEVGDNEAPKFDCPLPMDEQTDPREPTASVSYTVPTATDTVDGTVQVTCDPPPGTPFGIGSNTVTCTATDSAGNTKTCPFEITVADNEVPQFDCPIDMTDLSADAGEAFATVNYDLPAVTDNVDKDIQVTCDKAPGSQFPIGTSQVICSATDNTGNSRKCSFPIEVKDKEIPALTCPLPMSQNTDLGQPYATVTYTVPVPTDNADSNPLVSCERASGSQFWIEANEVICTATDKYGNVATCTFPVEVTDKEDPTITCPDPMEGLSTDSRKDYATVDYVIPTGRDNADDNPIVSCDRLPNSQFAIGSNVVTCTVTDKYQNSAECTFPVEVIDDERPRITCPLPMPDVTTDDGLATALIIYELATANDNADPNPDVTCTPASNTAFPIGSTTVRCKATDDAGNKRSCNFQVDVRDDEEPKMECPIPMSVSTDIGRSFASINYEVPTATDNVDATLVVTCLEPPGSEFTLGQTTVVCSVGDNAGNEKSCSFTIDVTDDEKPELECSNGMTEPVDSGENFATVEYKMPIVIDNADPAPDVDCQPASGSQLPVGANEIICTANDDAGNENTCKFTVTVEDNEGPTIECPIPMPQSADLGSTTTTVTYDDPTVFDNTDPNPVVSCEPASGSEFQIGANKVTCTATDDALNSNTCAFTVVVKDTEAPELTCPLPMIEDMDVGQSFATVPYDIPAANDNWDTNPQVTCTPAPSSIFNAGVNPVVCTAVDEAHNKKNCSFTIEVQDNEKPTVTCPNDMSEFVDAGQAFATVDYNIPSANDNADPQPKVNCDLKPDTQFPIGPNLVTCRARDVSTNRQKCTFTVEVTDNEPPKFTCPISMTSISVDQGQSFATVAYVLNTANDNADPAPTVTCDKPSGSEFPLGPTVITCTASDQYGNSKECTFRVEVTDDEAPEFDCPIPMVVPTDGGLPSAVVGYVVPTATDNADGEVSVTCTPAPDTVFSVGVNNVTCTATDSKGNTKICPFTVTVEDKEKPDFDCPIPMSGISVNPGQAYAIVEYLLPDATDNVDSNIRVYCVPAPSSKFPLGSTNVACIATDKAKNSERCSFPIEVRDDEAPKFNCPLPMTEETDEGLPTAEVYYSLPTATDNADGDLPVTCEPAPNSAFPVGGNTVVCSVTDSAGNSKSCPFTITVEDKEAPKFVCPIPMFDIPNDAGKKSAVVDYTLPSATDNEDETVTVTCEKASGSVFPVGTTVVLCNAEDRAGNSDSCSFPVEVVDKEAPEFDCPIDMTSNTDKGSSTAAVSYTVPTATDNGDGSVSVTCVPAPGTPLAVGPTTVQCTATDSAGNTKSCPFEITVEDKEAPEFECPLPMEDAKVDAGKDFGTVVYQTPEADDNVDSNVQVTCVKPSGSQFPIGRSDVVCTAADSAGNSKECSFPVVVKDNEAPTFDCPIPMTVATSAGLSTAVISYTVPTAKDNADDTIAVTCTPEPGSVIGVGTATIGCTATDSAGNTKTCSFPITVEDREDPQFDCPIPMDVNVDPGKNYATVDYTLPVVQDNVDSALQVSCDKPSGSQFWIGNTKVTCSATDSANNQKTCTFHVDVTDNEAPEFECLIPMTEPTDPGQPTAAVVYTTPTANDNVDITVHVTCTPASGTALRVGENIVSCISTDSAGNAKTCAFTITVEDKEEPDFTCPTPMIGVSVDPGQTYATVTYSLPRVTDNLDCSSTLSVSCVEAPGSQFPIGTSVVTCTASDMAGNSKTCTFTIEVKDDEAPKFDCPLPMKESTDAGLPTWAATYTEPTATDNLDGNVPVSCVPAPGAPFAVGPTTVTCTATDSNGNKKTCPFTITVEDKEAPVIDCPIDMTDLSPNQGQVYATVVYQLPQARDNKDANPTIVCDKSQAYQFPIGVTTVTCSATDNALNTKECSFTIEVKDTTPPDVDCPVDMTFNSPSEIDFVVSRDVSATDNDGSSRPVTCDNAQISYSNGRNTVTCRATDASGNEGTCQFDIIIDPPLCEFPTEANSYNTYMECATPLSPNDRTQVCFKGSSGYNMYVAIWDKQDPMLQPGMIDLNIMEGTVEIAHEGYFAAESIPGFSSGDPKLCVRRDPTDITILYDGTPLYTTPTGAPLTEVGFASSDEAFWTAQSYFGPIGSSRRRRSVDDNDPLRTAVKRRRRRAAGDDDGDQQGDLLKSRSKFEKRRR